MRIFPRLGVLRVLMQEMPPLVELQFVQHQHEMKVEAPLGKDPIDLVLGPSAKIQGHRCTERRTRRAAYDPSRLSLAHKLKGFKAVALQGEVPRLPVRLARPEIERGFSEDVQIPVGTIGHGVDIAAAAQF